jgi:hypothetical protein
MTTDEKIKAITAALAVATLVWSAYSFIQLRAVEAAKPYLEKKLAWCETAVETTARIANANPIAPNDVERFWQMYWGVMGLIEKQSITDAMIAFGDELNKAPTEEPELWAGDIKGEFVPHTGLQAKSLALAHACRHELSLEWSGQWARQ